MFNPTHTMFISRTLVTLLAAIGLIACGGEVDVGEAKQTATEGDLDDAVNADEGSQESEATTGSVGGAVPAQSDCSVEATKRHQPYVDWLGLTNDLSSLAGAVFVGYLEGGDDLQLTINKDMSAHLIVDEAAPAPEADKGYLCIDGDNCFDPISELVAGATYVIHGASVDDARVQLPLQPFSPYDAWCALQQPQPWGDCLYDVVGSGEIQWGERGCYVGSEEVDCSWFELAQHIGPCSCGPDSCVAAISSGDAPTTLDLRYDETEGTLDGSVVFQNGESRTVRLTLAE